MAVQHVLSLLMAIAILTSPATGWADTKPRSPLQGMLATYRETGRTPPPRLVVDALAREGYPSRVTYEEFAALLQASHEQEAGQIWSQLRALAENGAEVTEGGLVRFSPDRQDQARELQRQLHTALEGAGHSLALWGRVWLTGFFTVQRRL